MVFQVQDLGGFEDTAIKGDVESLRLLGLGVRDAGLRLD